MWRNTYKDYKPDTDWVKEKVEPGRGIIGAEMHELNGWGETYHHFREKKKKGFLRILRMLLGQFLVKRK